MYLSQKEKKRHPEYEQYIALFEETITQMESGARGRGAPEAIIERCLDKALEFYDADSAALIETNLDLGYLTYACATGIKKGQCTRRRTRFTYVDTRIREALQDEIDLADSIYSRIEAGELPAACVQEEDQYHSMVQQLLDATLQSNREFQALHSDFLLGKVTAEQYTQQKHLLMNQTRISGQHLLDAASKIKSFRALFTLDNPWLKLYHGKILPEVLPREVSKSYLERVCLSPDGEISIMLRYQGWKQKLLDMED